MVVLLLPVRAALQVDVQFLALPVERVLPAGLELGVLLVLRIRADPVIVLGQDIAAVELAVGLGRLAEKRPAVETQDGAELVAVVDGVIRPGLGDVGDGPRMLHGALLGAEHRVGRRIEVAAVIRGGAQAVILPDAVAPEEIILPRIIIGAQADVVPAVVADTATHRTRITGIVFPLQHDVDDARGPVGLVLGGGICDHLDAVDGIRRHLGQHVGAIRPHERGRLAVDQDEDAVGATQAHGAVDVHLGGRDVLDQVAGRTVHALDVLADIIDLAVDGVVEVSTAARDDGLFQHLDGFVERQFPQVNRRMRWIHGKRHGLPAIRSDRTVCHQVVAGGHMLQPERPLAVGHHGLHRFAIGLLPQRDGDIFQRMVIGLVDHQTGDGTFGRFLGPKADDQAEKEKDREKADVHHGLMAETICRRR